jgi:hypothetical protein
VDNRITYLNCDLVLQSPHDISTLAALFQNCDMKLLHVTHGDDTNWYATIEPDDFYDEPAKSIDALLTVIEALPQPLKNDWLNCSPREFNIGYDCGDEPWAFNQSLSTDLLGRMAKIGGTLRITLYPDRFSKTDAAPAT